jgi:hypothetical protein
VQPRESTQELDRRWREQVEVLTQALQQAQTGGASPPTGDGVALAPARLLHALTSLEGEAAMRREASDAITPEALEQRWFANLGNPYEAPLGRVLAMLILVDVAAEQSIELGRRRMAELAASERERGRQLAEARARRRSANTEVVAGTLLVGVLIVLSLLVKAGFYVVMRMAGIDPPEEAGPIPPFIMVGIVTAVGWVYAISLFQRAIAIAEGRQPRAKGDLDRGSVPFIIAAAVITFLTCL